MIQNYRSNLKITVPIEPVAQGRPRASTRGGFVKMYDPPKSREYKKQVKLILEQHKPSKPLETPLRVKMTFNRQYLKSFTKKQLKQAEDGFLMPVSRPDLDNYAKAMLDAMNGIIYKDDSQIVSLTLEKKYASESFTEIEINEV